MTDKKIELKESPLQRRARRQRRNRIILVVSVVIAILAWLYGYLNTGTDVLPYVTDVIPGADRVEVDGDIYTAYDENDDIVGYAATGEAQGYGGPILVLVGVNPEGEILGIEVIEQRETPGFYRLITRESFIEAYQGRSYDDPLVLGEDLDAVSGATLSAEGIAMSTREALRTISNDALSSSRPDEDRPIEFGFPELVLLSLFAFGYIGHRIRGGQVKKAIRWGSLLTGMIVLGFIYTAPLTIAMIISLLSGYLPDWQSNLYWYFLIGGILFVTTVDAKNPYCNWFCPFGCYQELLAKVTGAKLYKPRRWREWFVWLQRGLAFIAVIMGLALRQPGVAGYEPFYTLFDLRGTTIQWIFLGVVTLASLLMYRPFCNYLCPLDPVVDFIAETRRWIREGWKRWQNRHAQT
jgi:uncharacterized protein with FMN-binding domain